MRAMAKWRTAQQIEDYVNMVSDLMLPHVAYGKHVLDPGGREFRMERPTILGAMVSPVRRHLVFETWSPREIAIFEGTSASA